MRLRILTYNMHKGFCFYSRQYVLRELRAAIRAVDADIVFLQEVMGMHPVEMENEEEELDSQFEYLADQIWHHYAYGKNAIYSTGHHGNAILSKYPFRAYENINVSTNPLERRGLLHAEVEIKGRPVHLVCLHFDLLETGRQKQMQSLIERVRSATPDDCSLIVAGDFNDWKRKFSDPMASELNLQESGVAFTGKHARTFPCWAPLLPLDRVYTRKFQVHDYRVLKGEPWRKMSDHAAVVVDLGL
ncbi:MAG TPA: endonuclease/exonuclease/phosphatase family protein [Bdellovibrionales bacterium]|nr:endonuclease/exonuclease/phosphatase family protein [Bdellovibrionales bacterium]